MGQWSVDSEECWGKYNQVGLGLVDGINVR